jgi:predicted metal-dependent hydrolase
VTGELHHDPRYLAYFEHFNRQEYFEAHEVLEGLWLATAGNHRDFYKGLIQTAAVYLKLQEGKLEPAGRLAARALALLKPYEPRFQGLDVQIVTQLLRNATLQPSPPRLTPEALCV